MEPVASHDVDAQLTPRAVAKSLAASVSSVFTGWGRGYRRLAQSHASSVAGDALVGVALAGTLFFSVPSTDARQNVALYLLLTLAPFALIGPLLGRAYDRAPGTYRAGLILSSAGRVVIAIMIGFAVDAIWVFPLAFGLLVLSRFFGISRSSVLPVVVRNTDELIDANARLARAGVIAAALVVPLGAGGAWLFGVWAPLVGAAILYLVSTIAATQLPPVTVVRADTPAKYTLPRQIRLARFATAGVRFLNGYLVLLVAFALRDVDAGIASLATLLAAAGLGYFVAAWLAPTIGRYVREEPMVVGALAVMAIAAFIGAQVLSLLAASVLALAAGFAWGTAKFAFDGMMHVSVPAVHRGRAFTNSETMFQIAWVMGALIPVVPFWPTELGLSSAGVLALVIQVAYVSLVLVPESVRAAPVVDEPPGEAEPTAGVLDLL
ncbi:MAG: hypothetical protein QNJ71_03415 [Acidimicrobiia bacterium]|nr:hypothetical protein [Acidimicrobiia bacterium]